MNKNRMNEDKDKKVKNTKNTKNGSGSRPPQKRKAEDAEPKKRRQSGDSSRSRSDISGQTDKRPAKKVRPNDNEQRKQRSEKSKRLENEERRKKTTAKSKNSRKKRNDSAATDKKDYGDEFYTDELELKRRRAKQKHDEKLVSNIDFEKEPMSHRRRKLKNVGVAVSIVSCFLIIGIILSLTVFFRSEEITVEGAEHYSAQDVIAASGMALGENLFLCDKRAGEEKIENELPYVEEAKISIKIPGTMVITVTESQPAFLFENNGEYIIVSSHGKVLDKVTGSVDKYDAPLVIGCTIKSAELAQEIKFKESGVLSILESVAEGLADNEFSGIKEIDLTNTANICLNYSNRIKIILGLPEDISYKIKVAKVIISEKLSETDRGELDVSGCKEKNKASYFKPNSSIYLDRIEETEPLTQPMTEATEQTTEAATEYYIDEPTDDYSAGVPEYQYPTDEYGNIIYSTDPETDDSQNGYDNYDDGYDSYDDYNSYDDGYDDYYNYDNYYDGYSYTPDDDLYQ